MLAALLSTTPMTRTGKRNSSIRSSLNVSLMEKETVNVPKLPRFNSVPRSHENRLVAWEYVPSTDSGMTFIQCGTSTWTTRSDTVYFCERICTSSCNVPTSLTSLRLSSVSVLNGGMRTSLGTKWNCKILEQDDSDASRNTSQDNSLVSCWLETTISESMSIFIPCNGYSTPLFTFNFMRNAGFRLESKCMVPSTLYSSPFGASILQSSTSTIWRETASTATFMFGSFIFTSFSVTVLGMGGFAMGKCQERPPATARVVVVVVPVLISWRTGVCGGTLGGGAPKVLLLVMVVAPAFAGKLRSCASAFHSSDKLAGVLSMVVGIPSLNKSSKMAWTRSWTFQINVAWSFMAAGLLLLSFSKIGKHTRGRHCSARLRRVVDPGN
mmetsp:Transcript_22529/g.51949  ORF Transcript_22529/g.51949 Transcript_22529/m.51949 type:complete len:382 (-) Transcript_22529:976-2121(-)